MSEQEIRFLEGSFERLRLYKEDLIVLSFPERLTDDWRRRIEEHAKRFFPKNGILVLDGGAKLGVVSPS